mmetsp:Transcript_40731/g.91768  ORF Transcript_40731/g.91768 Transcript_40731/m.91768 type:complete len:308 (-) Transcript_40731:553-1476(-)
MTDLSQFQHVPLVHRGKVHLLRHLVDCNQHAKHTPALITAQNWHSSTRSYWAIPTCPHIQMVPFLSPEVVDIHTLLFDRHMAQHILNIGKRKGQLAPLVVGVQDVSFHVGGQDDTGLSVEQFKSRFLKAFHQCNLAVDQTEERHHRTVQAAQSILRPCEQLQVLRAIKCHPGLGQQDARVAIQGRRRPLVPFQLADSQDLVRCTMQDIVRGITGLVDVTEPDSFPCWMTVYWHRGRGPVRILAPEDPLRLIVHKYLDLHSLGSSTTQKLPQLSFTYFNHSVTIQILPQDQQRLQQGLPLVVDGGRGR